MILDASRPRRSRGSRRGEAAAHADEELPPRLIPSLRRFIATAVSIGHTRLALAGLELEEEIQRLIGATVMALVMLLLVNLALVVGTFAIVFTSGSPDEIFGGSRLKTLRTPAVTLYGPFSQRIVAVWR